MQTVTTDPALPEHSDAELVALATRGDAGAFEAIMRRNNRRLFRLARSILKDDAEAEEVVQETYLKAFIGLAGITSAASLSAWLASVAANEALGRLRRRRPAADLDLLADSLCADGTMTVTLQAPSDSPESAAARGEIRLLLERAIDALPQSFRTVFVLRAVEGLSVEDTARCLAIPRDTVKTRFHRARRALREALSEQLAAALADTFPFAGRRCDRIVTCVLARIGHASNDPPPTTG